MPTRVSIIIPTHNRANDVLENIDCLLPQIADQPFEIIVVDSASTPEQFEQLRPLGEKTGVTLLRSETPGASRARNIAVERAQGDWLSFLDDDVIVHANWASKVQDGLNHAPQNLAIIGGRVEAQWPATASQISPLLIGPRAKVLLSVIEDKGSYQTGTTPKAIGANMLIKRTALLQIGGFPESLGRVGTNLVSGEETHAVESIIALKYDSRYDGEIAVNHKISAGRLTREWLERRAKHEGAVTYRRVSQIGGRMGYVARCASTLPLLAPRRKDYDASNEIPIRFNHNVGVVLSAFGKQL